MDTDSVGFGQILLVSLQGFLGMYLDLNTVFFPASLSPWAEVGEQGGQGVGHYGKDIS